jgi:two-component system alkaline phosphatase synthesis response regulator PhoP
MKRILVIEDDRELLIGLRDNLEIEGYEVVTAADGDIGVTRAVDAAPDAVILDVMLPTLDGFEVCRELKHRGLHMPILMLTARNQESDKIRGLELGADDYVTKPFSINELLARVKAMLRRAHEPAARADGYAFDDVVVNFRRQSVVKGRKLLALSTLEFDVLRYLIARAGKVVTRDQLLSDVWGYHAFPTTRSVDNLVVRLRQKLERNPHHPQHILTVHGSGYKFVD